MKLLCTALLLAVSCAVPAFASIYVTTSATETNCSSAAAFKGYFEASSFTFGGSASVASAYAGNNSVGKLLLQNLTISKVFDNCSGPLITQFLTEQKIPTVILVETELTGNTSVNILTITLTNALITNYSLSDGARGGVGAEAISFNFQKACIVSTPTTITGGAGKSTQVCYDAVKNQVN